VVEVVDTGVGISKIGIEKLFSLFGKLKDSLTINKKGIGLGLMIS
jgi:signal transduction histidine kinase